MRVLALALVAISLHMIVLCAGKITASDLDAKIDVNRQHTNMNCLYPPCLGSYVSKKAKTSTAKAPIMSVKELEPRWDSGKAFLMTLDNPSGHFHIYFPQLANGTCGGVKPTSQQARERKCLFATDAAPGMLNGTGPVTCRPDLFSVASDGVLYHVVSGTHWNANFGLTKNGYFVMGPLTAQQIKSVEWDQLISGFTVLLINGTIQNQTIPEQPPGQAEEPEASATTTLQFSPSPFDPPPSQLAPRVAIGVDKAGRLMIFEVDGIEKAFRGVTVLQFALWFKELGAVHALNLDGGGSAVVFYNGTIIDHPTCKDTPEFCERNGTTITCVN